MSNNLPATMSSLVTSLETATTVVASTTGGMGFLRMLKDGAWVYGSDDGEVVDGSLWAVNPNSFAMGFQAWDDEGELLGEELALVTEPPILKGNLAKVDGEWKQMLAVQIACIEGDDKGAVLKYGTTSKGGIKAINTLMQDLVKRIKDPKADGKFVPVVELLTDSYKHKKYGKIYTPVLQVHRWLDLDDSMATTVIEAVEEEEIEEEEPQIVAEPTRRRRRG
jgi:hypothetical protein